MILRKRIFRQFYEKEKQDGVVLARMSAKAIAGYYLMNYPNDPIRALKVDMWNDTIPHITGETAKLFLEII